MKKACNYFEISDLKLRIDEMLGKCKNGAQEISKYILEMELCLDQCNKIIDNIGMLEIIDDFKIVSKFNSIYDTIYIVEKQINKENICN